MATFEVASRQEEEENEEEDDQEDDEDDEDEVEGPNPYIQLGYIDQKVNNLFLNKNWKEWDGGCIGGKPVSIFFYQYFNCYTYDHSLLIRFGFIENLFHMLKNYDVPTVIYRCYSYYRFTFLPFS